MGSRKDANRAEAIVRGVGAIVLLLVLAVMVYALPQILKEKNPTEMLSTMMQMLIGLAMLVGVVTVIGVIVWLKVLKGKSKPNPRKTENPFS
jgi:NADH:ubiquinone oxidoreductase subunit 6 (subunit J)